jgi:hypothetical protein
MNDQEFGALENKWVGCAFAPTVDECNPDDAEFLAQTQYSPITDRDSWNLARTDR